MGTLKTKKIKSDDTKSGFITINEEDFDPDKHDEFKEKKSETIKIVDDNEAGFKEIPKSDFDKKIHKKFTE